MSIRKASHDNVRLRIAMCGESNSGKTFSALLLAKAINGSLDKTIIIDTECRGDLYTKYYPGYSIYELTPKFDPEKAIAALDECAKAGMETVIFDSASDIWERTKQIHDEITGTNLKLSYYTWAKVTPRWDAFRAAINNYPGHVFSCWRMKEKLVQKDGAMVSDGNKVVARGGSKGIKYDYQIAFAIDDKHHAVVGKDNLHLFSDWTTPRIIDVEVGKKIRDWCIDTKTK